MHTQLDLASADWIAIYRRLGAKARRGTWRSSTPSGIPCFCPMAAILAHAGILPASAKGDDFADLAAMTWTNDFREGFVQGFDYQDPNEPDAHEFEEYQPGYELGRRVANTLRKAGLIYP